MILGNLAYLQLQHEYAGNVAMERDGRWYCKHSYESLAQWHEYLSVDQLKRLMKKLEDGGYVVKGHLGKPFDRTLYWSVSPAVVDSAKSHDPVGEIARSDSAKSHDVLQTNNNKQERRSQKSSFQKPNVEEIAEYIESLPNSLPTSKAVSEAEKLFDHYESNGWKVGGKAPMKCWKSATRNWMRRNFDDKNDAPKYDGVVKW